MSAVHFSRAMLGRLGLAIQDVGAVMTRLAALAIVALFGLLQATPSASAQDLISCAREGGFCRVPYPTEVVYGVPGRSISRYVEGRGIPCSNEAFGDDPAPGVGKHCSFVGGRGRRSDSGRGGGWRTCAQENGFCEFRGKRLVRYGREGSYRERTFRNGVPCNNQSFGDPAPGVPKVCQVRD